MRSNLAYDYRRYQTQEEEYEEQYEEAKEPEIEPKKRSINGYVMAIVLGAMILVPGAIHVNCIYSKMKCSMKIATLEKRKVELNAEINKLKADYDKEKEENSTLKSENEQLKIDKQALEEAIRKDIEKKNKADNSNKNKPTWKRNLYI